MAITIGFADEMEQTNGQEEISIKKQQEIIEQAKKIIVKIPERRIPEILEGFDCVVVNIFDDDYHATDEEREKNNMFAKYAKKIKSMKRIYRRLDEYVVAVREHLKFLDKVAEDNGVYSPEEFKKMFFKGKIDIVGMRFPKYKGPNRKDINYQYLAEFVISGNDPIEILPKWQRNDFDEEDEIDVDNYFTDEELKEIFRPLTKEESRYEYTVFNADEDSQDNVPVGVTLTTKQSKKLIKSQPELVAKLKEMKLERRTLDKLSDSFLHNSIYDDISEIAKYDQNYYYVSDSDIPEFHGDVLNDKDFYKYMKALNEFEENNVVVNYSGKDKTVGEVKELELKQILEEDGWNIRNFVENREQEAKMKKIAKRDKKKEKELKRHLLDIQERQKARKNGEKYIPKKHKEKDKKNKEKKKDLKDIKKKVDGDFTDLLMESVGATESSFKEYKERALDLTGLFGGNDADSN